MKNNNPKSDPAPGGGGNGIAKRTPAEEEKMQERVIEYEKFYESQSILPYGLSDIRAAIEFFIDAGLTGEDLAEQVIEFCDDTETKLADVDVCGIAYDYVLQMARNKIDKIIGYDLCNDFRGDTGIYVAANYCCTSYDYSDAAIKDLTKKLSKATNEQKDKLRDDRLVMFFLGQINIIYMLDKKRCHHEILRR